MKKRLLGTLVVSEIGTGCMGFSHGYGKVPEEDYSVKAIQQAYDFGCTFFDTAEGYGAEQFFPGHNEQLVGKAIEPFRQDIVLATKFKLQKEEYGEGVSLYDAIHKHIEKSLQNLRTDYIDLYYLHRVNQEIPVEEIAGVMGQLRQEGLIKGWGMSQVDVATLSAAHQVEPVSAVQNLYSMLERDCEKEIFPYCIANHIGVVPFSPIASGFLSGKVTTDTAFGEDDVRKFVPQLSKENIEGNQPILKILEKFSAEKGATNAQISLAWMLHKYPNVVPIPGSKNEARILENLGGSQVWLSKTEFEDLEEALAACEIYGHRGTVESEQSGFGDHWKKK